MQRQWLRIIACLALLYGVSADVFAETISFDTRWYDNIALSGSLSLGAYASPHTPTTVGIIPAAIGKSPGATDISIVYANLDVNARLSPWIKTLFAIAYQQASPSFIRSPDGGGNSIVLDRAYLTIQNSACSPFFAKIGWQWLPFGGFDTSSLTESTTQLLSNTRETTPLVGFEKWHGLSASVYIFRGLSPIRAGNTTNARGYGTALVFEQGNESAKYRLGAGYISTLINAYYTASTVANGSPLGSGTYTKAVPGLDLNIGGNIKAFDISAKYIGSLTSFTVNDIPYTTHYGATFKGARPTAWGVNAGYQFDVMNFSSRLGAGYQGSNQAVSLGKASGSVTNAVAGIYGTSFAIGMPRARFYTNYRVNPVKWADLAVELAHDSGYSTRNGGTGRSTMLGALMATVRFG